MNKARSGSERNYDYTPKHRNRRAWPHPLIWCVQDAEDRVSLKQLGWIITSIFKNTSPTNFYTFPVPPTAWHPEPTPSASSWHKHLRPRTRSSIACIQFSGIQFPGEDFFLVLVLIKWIITCVRSGIVLDQNRIMCPWRSIFGICAAVVSGDRNGYTQIG